MTQPGGSDSERKAQNMLDNLEAHAGAIKSIEAVRLAASALGYIAADAHTLQAAKTTARGALAGIQKELDREWAAVLAGKLDDA